MNAKSSAYQTETSEHASSEMFLPSRLNALREQLLRADEKNAELELERKAKKEEERQKGGGKVEKAGEAVSYTHLTLPTILRV